MFGRVIAKFNVRFAVTRFYLPVTYALIVRPITKTMNSFAGTVVRPYRVFAKTAAK